MKYYGKTKWIIKYLDLILNKCNNNIIVIKLYKLMIKVLIRLIKYNINFYLDIKITIRKEIEKIKNKKVQNIIMSTVSYG